MGIDDLTPNHSRPQTESEHSILSPMDYESLLAQVVQLVEDAGLLLITEWQRPEGPRGSGDKADVDVEIESLLKPRLLQLLDCDFWGEETGHRLTGARYCWVVDPNDGTADFLKGHKGSAISVGLLEDAQPVLGVVYAPVLLDGDSDCVAWAKGAPCVLRNGSPIKATLAKKNGIKTAELWSALRQRTSPKSILNCAHQVALWRCPASPIGWHESQQVMGMQAYRLCRFQHTMWLQVMRC